MANYIPHSDPEFNMWQMSLVEILAPNLVAWGILADDFTALTTSQNLWLDAYTRAFNKQNRTSADVQAKDDAREAFEKSLRKFVAQWLAYNSKVSNSDRERMGLTVKSGSRTPVSIPGSSPVGNVDFSVRLQHSVNFYDQSTPGSKAKPVGVHGCEIWSKIDGVAPVDSSELTFLATDTRSPHIARFEGKYAGKTVYYWMRWVNTRGEHGPWGNPISAMVAG